MNVISSIGVSTTASRVMVLSICSFFIWFVVKCFINEMYWAIIILPVFAIIIYLYSKTSLFLANDQHTIFIDDIYGRRTYSSNQLLEVRSTGRTSATFSIHFTDGNFWYFIKRNGTPLRENGMSFAEEAKFLENNIRTSMTHS